MGLRILQNPHPYPVRTGLYYQLEKTREKKHSDREMNGAIGVIEKRETLEKGGKRREWSRDIGENGPAFARPTLAKIITLDSGKRTTTDSLSGKIFDFRYLCFASARWNFWNCPSINMGAQMNLLNCFIGFYNQLQKFFIRRREGKRFANIF